MSKAQLGKKNEHMRIKKSDHDINMSYFTHIFLAPCQIVCMPPILGTQNCPLGINGPGSPSRATALMSSASIGWEGLNLRPGPSWAPWARMSRALVGSHANGPGPNTPGPNGPVGPEWAGP